MSIIVRNPKIQDNVREVDVSTTDGPAEARTAYEAGNIVILKRRRIELDYQFLNGLNFDIDGPPELLKQIKKFTDNKIALLDPSSKRPADQLLFESVFDSDAGKLSFYKEQVQLGNRQLGEIYQFIFPNYSLQKVAYTWRFTTTLFENLHWDNFHTDLDFHQVRIFLNVDTAPRIWRCSHGLEQYATQIWREKNLDQWNDVSGDQLVFLINNNILGGMAHSLMDGLDLHHIAFEQGDIWLAETRIASHQIYSGRRAVASMFYVDPASMDNPELSFTRRVERLRSRLQIEAA